MTTARIAAEFWSQSQISSLSGTKIHTTTHCNTLQPTATHCNPLQPTATHCNPLQHTATHCNTLQPTATHSMLSETNKLHPDVCKYLKPERLHKWPTMQHNLRCNHRDNTLQTTHCNPLQHTATHCNQYTSNTITDNCNTRHSIFKLNINKKNRADVL